MTLEEDIRSAINRHCAENRSNTPDYILAHYMLSCLHAFEQASIERESWYGTRLYPGKSAGLVAKPPTEVKP